MDLCGVTGRPIPFGLVASATIATIAAIAAASPTVTTAASAAAAASSAATATTGCARSCFVDRDIPATD